MHGREIVPVPIPSAQIIHWSLPGEVQPQTLLNQRLQVRQALQFHPRWHRTRPSFHYLPKLFLKPKQYVLVRENVINDVAQCSRSAGAAGGKDYLCLFGEALIGELRGGHVGVDKPVEKGSMSAATQERVAVGPVELIFLGRGDGLECHLYG